MNIPERWYRKLEVSSAKANKIEDGLSNNAEKFKKEDLREDTDPFSTLLKWEGKIFSDEQSTKLVY